MSYIVNIPKSDDAREAALSTAKARNDEADEGTSPFSAANQAALNVREPAFKHARNVFDICAGAFKSINDSIITNLAKLKSLASHAMQIVNFKIIDKLAGWEVAIRAVYHLHFTGKLGPLNTEAQIKQLASDFIDGETTRVAAGGAPLTEYPKSMIKTALDNLGAQILEKSTKKDAMGDAQDALTAERKLADDLIVLLWDDIEHAAQSKSKGVRHEFCMEWGMTFTHIPNYGRVNVRAEDFDTHAILPGVLLRLGKNLGTGGPQATTNTHGEAFLESKNFDPTQIVATLILYERTVVDITLIEDETIDIVIRMKKLGA